MFWRLYNESYFLIQSQNLCHKAILMIVIAKSLHLVVFQQVTSFRAGGGL